MIVKVDVPRDPISVQRLDLDGNGIEFTLRFEWSKTYQRFYMSIFDASGTPVSESTKLVPGTPINLGNRRANGPLGLLLMLGSGDITRSSFADGSYSLFYFPRQSLYLFPLSLEYAVASDFILYLDELNESSSVISGFLWGDLFNTTSANSYAFPLSDFGGGGGLIKSTGLEGTANFDARWTRSIVVNEPLTKETLTSDTVDLSVVANTTQVEGINYALKFPDFTGDFEMSLDVTASHASATPPLGPTVGFDQIIIGGSTYVFLYSHSIDLDGVGGGLISSQSQVGADQNTGGSYSLLVQKSGTDLTLTASGDVSGSIGPITVSGALTDVIINMSNGGGGSGTAVAADLSITNFTFQVGTPLANFVLPSLDRWKNAQFHWSDFGGGDNVQKSTGLAGTEPFDTRWARTTAVNFPISESLANDLYSVTMQSATVQNEGLKLTSNAADHDNDFEMSVDVTIGGLATAPITGPVFLFGCDIAGSRHWLAWWQAVGRTGLGYDVGGTWTETTATEVGGSWNFKVRRVGSTVTFLIDDVSIGSVTASGTVSAPVIVTENTGGGIGTQSGADITFTNYNYKIGSPLVNYQTDLNSAAGVQYVDLSTGYLFQELSANSGTLTQDNLFNQGGRPDITNSTWKVRADYRDLNLPGDGGGTSKQLLRVGTVDLGVDGVEGGYRNVTDGGQELFFDADGINQFSEPDESVNASVITEKIEFQFSDDYSGTGQNSSNTSSDPIFNGRFDEVLKEGVVSFNTGNFRHVFNTVSGIDSNEYINNVRLSGNFTVTCTATMAQYTDDNTVSQTANFRIHRADTTALLAQIFINKADAANNNDWGIVVENLAGTTIDDSTFVNDDVEFKIERIGSTISLYYDDVLASRTETYSDEVLIGLFAGSRWTAGQVTIDFSPFNITTEQYDDRLYLSASQDILTLSDFGGSSSYNNQKSVGLEGTDIFDARWTRFEITNPPTSESLSDDTIIVDLVGSGTQTEGINYRTNSLSEDYVFDVSVDMSIELFGTGSIEGHGIQLLINIGGDQLQFGWVQSAPNGINGLGYFDGTSFTQLLAESTGGSWTFRVTRDVSDLVTFYVTGDDTLSGSFTKSGDVTYWGIAIDNGGNPGGVKTATGTASNFILLDSIGGSELTKYKGIDDGSGNSLFAADQITSLKEVYDDGGSATLNKVQLELDSTFSTSYTAKSRLGFEAPTGTDYSTPPP